MKKKTTLTKSEFETVDAIDFEKVDDESRTVYLVGDITEDVIRTTTERIITLSERDPKKPIVLIINTAGGSIDDTFMLYDLMKYVPTPIHTVGLGKIMSAGCLLLAAGEKSHRLIGKNARVMYHCGFVHTSGSIFAIKADLEAFEQQEKRYDQCFADETGLTLKQVEKLYNKNGPTADKYISAVDAIRLGIADSLI